MACIIMENFHGKVPRTMADLLKLPGVGRKTANVVLSFAFGKTEGVVVDTHVARLTRLWGLTKQTDPGKIEQDLMRLMPHSQWKLFSLRTILYGRQYCPARPHNHSQCPVSAALGRRIR
jgi:endonuclease-3